MRRQFGRVGILSPRKVTRHSGLVSAPRFLALSHPCAATVLSYLSPTCVVAVKLHDLTSTGSFALSGLGGTWNIQSGKKYPFIAGDGKAHIDILALSRCACMTGLGSHCALPSPKHPPPRPSWIPRRFDPQDSGLLVGSPAPR